MAWSASNTPTKSAMSGARPRPKRVAFGPNQTLVFHSDDGNLNAPDVVAVAQFCLLAVTVLASALSGRL